ncbi:MAG: hypothetical protein HPY67_08360 [Syntrophaceae bacterium]|nr:hypothetical protein [Syntrophaceae bacterium]
MRRWIALLAFVSWLLSTAPLGASAPVSVTIRGCVTGGVLVSERTDFGTHVGEGKHRIRALGPDGSPLDLAAYEGKRVTLSGHLSPGDRFHAAPATLWVLGPCDSKEPETLLPGKTGPVYHNPAYKNHRVDRCWRYGAECDKAAADRFCRKNGYAGAAEWKTAAHRPTYVVGDGKICDASYCVGFTYIRCTDKK